MQLFHNSHTVAFCCELVPIYFASLQWRNNGRSSVSNHQPHDCLLNRLFRRRSKKISKLRVTGLCAGNSPVPRTNGQLHGKCFHLMTSSCSTIIHIFNSKHLGLLQCHLGIHVIIYLPQCQWSKYLSSICELDHKESKRNDLATTISQAK